MLFFNNFCSWLRIRFRNPAVSWMEVFVTKLAASSCWFLSQKTWSWMLRGSYILCCLLIFVKNCLCFAFLMLIFICYDCNELIINMFLNVCFFDLKIKFISLHSTLLPTRRLSKIVFSEIGTLI